MRLFDLFFIIIGLLCYLFGVWIGIDVGKAKGRREIQKKYGEIN